MGGRLKRLAWYWFCKGYYASRHTTEKGLRAVFLRYWRKLGGEPDADA